MVKIEDFIDAFTKADTERRRSAYNKLLDKIIRIEEKSNRHEKNTLCQWIFALIIAIFLFLAGLLFGK